MRRINKQRLAACVGDINGECPLVHKDTMLPNHICDNGSNGQGADLNIICLREYRWRGQCHYR